VAASAAVAINGRAAVREQIGGVERFAREISARLPALRPERYRVITPPAALAHRAGTNPDLIRREEAPYRDAAGIAEAQFGPP